MSRKRWIGTGLKLLPLLFGMVVWNPGPSLAAGFVVIANNSVVESSLTRKELQSIYLGEKIKWGNRKYIKISVLEEGAPYKDFLQSIVGKTPSQFDQHWMGLVTTGRSSMPPTFSDSRQVVSFVAGHPHAIGFVAAGQADSSVKIIDIK